MQVGAEGTILILEYALWANLHGQVRKVHRFWGIIGRFDKDPPGCNRGSGICIELQIRQAIVGEIETAILIQDHLEGISPFLGSRWK